MPDAGEIILVEFPGVVATKRRPAVVLSSVEYHKTRPDLIVGLVTSQTGKATGPTDHLIVDWQAAGLNAPSTFRAFLATLPKNSIVSTIGRLSTADWQAVQGCLSRSMVLN